MQAVKWKILASISLHTASESPRKHSKILITGPRDFDYINWSSRGRYDTGSQEPEPDDPSLGSFLTQKEKERVGVGGIQKGQWNFTSVKKKRKWKTPFSPDGKRNNIYLFWNKTIPKPMQKMKWSAPEKRQRSSTKKRLAWPSKGGFSD